MHAASMSGFMSYVYVSFANCLRGLRMSCAYVCTDQTNAQHEGGLASRSQALYTQTYMKLYLFYASRVQHINDKHTKETVEVVYNTNNTTSRNILQTIHILNTHIQETKYKQFKPTRGLASRGCSRAGGPEHKGRRSGQPYIYIYIYTYIHAYMYMYMCIYIYIYIHICTHLHINIYIYIYITCLSLYIYIHIQIHIQTQTYVCMYIYIYICIEIYACVYIYIYM